MNEDTLSSRRPTWEPAVPYTPPSDPSVNAAEPSRALQTQSLAYPDTVRPRDLQLLMKRLRKDLTTRGGSATVRYYGVGEYGDLYGRPHYHIALFGEDFSGDRRRWRTTEDGNPVWRSPRLEKLWGLGNCEIGELTIQSAAYIASYVMKKVNGKKADEHYRRIDPVTGEDIWLWPEFALMSRGGRKGRGLAYEWLMKYSPDVYSQDHLEHGGRLMRPPRYFDKLLDEIDPVRMTEIRFEREMRAKELAEDNTPARLAVKEVCLKEKLKRKKKQL